MNGTQTAEEWAESAAHSAQRSAQKAEAATNAVLEVHQALGGVLRELSDSRRENREGFKNLSRRVENLETYRTNARPLQDFDAEPSDTGSHMIVPADALDNLLAQRTGKRVRTLALAVGTGAATLGGEQILRFFLALFGHHH